MYDMNYHFFLYIQDRQNQKDQIQTFEKEIFLNSS